MVSRRAGAFPREAEAGNVTSWYQDTIFNAFFTEDSHFLMLQSRFGNRTPVLVKLLAAVLADSDLSSPSVYLCDFLNAPGSGWASLNPLNLNSILMLVASFLQELAIQEQREVEDVANDLLHFAIAEHLKDDEKLALWERLSPREKQVAALACLGHTNPEIGHLMFISTNTVKTHMRNLLEKVNVSSKMELSQLFAGWEFETWLKGQDLRADS